MKATFGAGCFWGVELLFSKTPGVTATAVGYMGGSSARPTYEDVCTDRTGHAEVVQIDYDPTKVSYEQLLELFWENHNPTTMNRQGPDFGSQYRSVIFHHSEEQRMVALASKEQAQSRFAKPIVTQVVPAVAFHRAEEYHQKYLEKRGMGSCHL
jgi:peptide-methionine (S)-S-oxide reductase